MTRKLYDENAYLAQFSAKVLTCEAAQNGYAVTLDATAFFPEGGGQGCDVGRLGGAEVTDVQLNGDEIVHLCASPLPVGEVVAGEIDWQTRFARMQSHTGEHILSGTVHKLTGYQNVGFHMGEDCITVDFSGKLSDEDIRDLQTRVNAIVQEDRPVKAWYPTEEELRSLPYRSKKEIEGAVRLVEIEDADLCACCAPHVKRTGEVGPILVLGRESFHGGTRLSMLCGKAATEYILAVLEENKGISALLSAKATKTHAAVQRMAEELGAVKLQLSQAQKELYASLAKLHENAENPLLFREGGDAGKIACAIAESCKGKCAVFVRTEGGYRYAVSEEGGNLSDFAKTLHAALGGRGGGRGPLIQGSVPASQKDIEAFWREEA